MFTEFKQFYSSLSSITPEVTMRQGRHAFLHRARVARENEDIESFRDLRNELIQYWYAYLDREEQKRDSMNSKLSQMLDTDIYPSHDTGNSSPRPSSGSAPESPIVLDVDRMTAEGIPMQGNQMSEAQKRQMQLQRARQLRMQRLMANRHARQAATTAANNAMNRLIVPFPPVQPANPQLVGSQPILQVQQQQFLQAQSHPNPAGGLTQQQLQHLQQHQQRCQQRQQQEAAARQANVQAAFQPTVPHPQSITLPGMPQQQSDFWAIAVADDSPSSSSNPSSQPLSAGLTSASTSSPSQSPPTPHAAEPIYQISSGPTNLPSSDTLFGSGQSSAFNRSCIGETGQSDTQNQAQTQDLFNPSFTVSDDSNASSMPWNNDKIWSNDPGLFTPIAAVQDAWSHGTIEAAPCADTSIDPPRVCKRTRTTTTDGEPAAKKSKKETDFIAPNHNDDVIVLGVDVEERVVDDGTWVPGFNAPIDPTWDGVGKGKGKARAEPEVVWLD
jgi:hypothetical protein